MPEYLSVSTLTKYLKMKFERDPYLERVYLTGQVSNFRRRPNHQYFSLKDEKAVIQVTIWSGVYQKLGFELEEGMKINVIGRVQLYEPSGSYSIIIEKAEPDGVGALAIQFEQLKKKLGEEGLFQDKFKQALPQFPKKIGVVTSPSGAVIRDIITTVSRRFPGVEIVLYPTKVQGDGAADQIADHIRLANERSDLDVLIIGRGGGSTLADFVADRRAATPTAAAELATPVTKLDLLGHLQQQENRMSRAISNRLSYYRERLNKLTQSVIFRQPERLYDGHLQKLDQLNLRLKQKIREYYSEEQQRVKILQHRLEALNPLSRVQRLQEQTAQLERLLRSNMAVIYDNKVAQVRRLSEALLMLDTSRIVARGYAIVQKNQKVVESSAGIEEKDELTLLMRDGKLEVEVKHVQRKEI